jgi:hypothetical protein
MLEFLVNRKNNSERFSQEKNMILVDDTIKQKKNKKRMAYEKKMQ